MNYVALLRGINVGGNNKLPMRDLAAIFQDAGCTTIQTYIQSGNVVFSAGAALATKIGTLVSRRVLEDSGMRIPVIVRSAADLQKVVSQNPFLRRKVDPEHLHVAFLSAAPSEAAVAALDPLRSPPDEFIVQRSEIYLHCPNGYGRTKLTNAYFDAKLAAVSTVRNWRTVQKLLELADGS